MLLTLGGARIAAAGSAVENLHLSSDPSPVEGHIVSTVIDVKWDTACLPLRFQVNANRDPLPNPLGEDFVTVEEARATLSLAASLWNDIPTSFIEMHVDEVRDNPGPSGFDQVSEITFRTGASFGVAVPRVTFSPDFGAIAFIRQTTLLAPGTPPSGLDLDRDGDVDVSDTITECTDIDGDGDFEYPEKLFAAGTLLDTDIVFNSGDSAVMDGPEGFRFTVDPDDVDSDPQSVDLLAAAIQIFGVVHGVAHIPTNQTSSTDGSGSVMFFQIDTADPDSQRAMHGIDRDAAITSSRLYPEGSADEGIAALQDGDVAFDDAFGIIEGEVFHGELDEPVLGANVFAVDRRTGEIVASTISGNGHWSSLPNGTGGVFLDSDFHVIDGKYSLVVPPGRYDVGVEAVDDTPIGHRNVNIMTILGFELGQDQFNEEFYNGDEEGALELYPNARVPVAVEAGEVRGGIDIVTNRTVDIANFGSLDSLGFEEAERGTVYAVRIPGDQFLEADEQLGPGALIQGAAFLTGSADSSVVPVFAKATLTTGRVNVDGSATIHLDRPLARRGFFVGQDTDFTPLYFRAPELLGYFVRLGMAIGLVEDLFLVLEVPRGNHFDADSPALIGLDGGVDENDVPIAGTSFIAGHGEAFEPVEDFNFMFKLILSRAP